MEQEANHAEGVPEQQAVDAGAHEVQLAGQAEAAAAAEHAAAVHAAAVAQQQADHHAQQLAHHAQQLAAAQQLQQEGVAVQGLELGGHDPNQPLPVAMADSATVAAAIAAGLTGMMGTMGSGMNVAQLLAGTPITAAHAQLLSQQHGEGMLGEMAGMSGPVRTGPASIPRGQEGYSRKAKSLSLLCENFVGQFGQVVNQVINLDNAAAQLGVERRRIYDIVNVLESIKVVSKLQKNQYQWHGTGKLVDTLTELHDEAQREMEEAKTLTGEDLASLGLDDRKEKSMSRLSQRFVQMFMLSKTRSLGLDEAARALLGGNEDQGQYKTKVRRLYDIANILSALKIIEKTHVGDKGKPGFRWLGPEGLQTMRPMAPTTHLAPPAPTAFHMPGSFQAALAGDLPPLNMANAVAAAGGVPEAAAQGADAGGGVQVSLPAPASLYVGGGDAGMAAVHAPQPAAGGGGGGTKRPRRKSLRAREAEADTEEDEDYVEEDEDEEGGKPRAAEEAAQKRFKVDQEAAAQAAAQQQAQAAAAAVQQHAGPAAGLTMFSEMPLVMPTADPATLAAMAGAYGMDMAAAAGQQANKPKVHPLLKFMELESQTEQGGQGMRRMVGADLHMRADGHVEGQVGDGTQAAAWPAAATWGGMGMEWLANPAMAASMYAGSFWPASYAANMATAARPAKPAGVADGQPAGGEQQAQDAAAAAAAAAAGGDAAAAAAAAGEQQQQAQEAANAAAAAAGGLPQVTFPYGVPKPEGAEGQMVVGAPDGAAPAPGAEGQQALDAQAAAQAAAAGGNPLAWQYWQYMYTNLYANAAANQAAAAVNPSVYTNAMYANWTKKHEAGTAEGGALEGAPAGDAGDAAPDDSSALPVGAYPVGGDMSGYAAPDAAAQHAAEQAQQAAAAAAHDPSAGMMEAAQLQQEGAGGEPVQH